MQEFNCQKHTEKISSIEKDLEYMKENLNEVKKLTKEFYSFKAEIKSMLHTWGVAITAIITVVSLFLKGVK